jgi:hypothetical protein
MTVAETGVDGKEETIHDSGVQSYQTAHELSQSQFPDHFRASVAGNRVRRGEESAA